MSARAHHERERIATHDERELYTPSNGGLFDTGGCVVDRFVLGLISTIQ